MISADNLFRKDPAGFKNYVHGMLACGQIAALNRIADLLRSGSGQQTGGKALVNALFSALILREEMNKVGIVVKGLRESDIVTRWQATLKLLDGYESREGDDKFWIAQVFALSRHVRNDPFNLNKARAVGIEKIFCSEVERACKSFTEFDRKWARQRVESRLRPLSRMLPEADRKVLEDHIDSQEKHGRNLGDFFGASTSLDDLRGIFERHANINPAVASVTLVANLVRTLTSDEERLDFAKTLQKNRDALKNTPPTARSRGYSQTQGLSAISAVAILGACLEIIKHGNTKNANGEPAEFSHIDLMYANLAPIDSSKSELQPIEIVRNHNSDDSTKFLEQGSWNYGLNS